MTMNFARFKAILSGQNNLAQKVYECVPEADGWTHAQIYAELQRKSYAMEFRTMQGCVNTLIAAGIVREVHSPMPNGSKRHDKTSLFKREAVRGRPKSPLDTQDTDTSSTIEAPIEVQKEEPMLVKFEAPSPIDKLGDLGAKARKLITELNALALEIDAAALAAQEFIEKNEATVKKAKALQAMLRESLE